MCLAGVVRPTAGAVHLDGQDLWDQPDRERSALRLEQFGIVMQFADLVSELSLVGNVALPLELLGRGRREALRSATEALAEVGLEAEIHRRPGEVSGGQAQRAAIARALVHGPAFVLADEPTGALDSGNSQRVAELFLTVARRRGAGVVLVTHDAELAGRADRVVRMGDGAVDQSLAPSR
jgi:putative ABC transport system ATP-binding protein